MSQKSAVELFGLAVITGSIDIDQWNNMVSTISEQFTVVDSVALRTTFIVVEGVPKMRSIAEVPATLDSKVRIGIRVHRR